MSGDVMEVRDAVAGYKVPVVEPEVPAGYKRTEVGVIPEDWLVGRLGDSIAALEAGVSVNSTDDEFDGDSPAILKTSCVQSGRFLPHEAKPIAERDLPRAILNPRKGTILVSRMNTIDLVGESGLVDRDYPTLFIPDRLWMTRFHSSEKISTEWLAYVLASPTYRNQLRSIATGTSGSMKNIAKHSFLDLPIAYPPPSEQHAIATALSDVDALITALDRLIAKKRAIKTATMQQLLTGETRLPGFSGEWETKRLGDHMKFLRNGTNSRSELSPGIGVKYLHYGDIHTRSSVRLDIGLERMHCLPIDKAKSLDRLHDGDLIFVDASEDQEGIGKSVEIINHSGIEAVAGLHTIAARFDKSVLADGFKAYLQFVPSFQRHLRRLCAGTK